MEVSLAQKSKMIAEEKRFLKIKIKVKEIKTKKLAAKFLKDILKKIDKTCNRGEFWVQYFPWFRWILGQWNEEVINHLILELKEKGYKCREECHVILNTL